MRHQAAIVPLIALSAGIAALLVIRANADRHFYDGYDPGAPLHAAATETIAVEKTAEVFGQPLKARYRRQRIEFDARPGERVPAVLTLPMKTEAPVPIIVLLHGSHQEKEFVEQICTPFNEAGFAMICFDQYMRGERKVTGGPLAVLRAYRQRCWKTVHDTRRLIDYLQTRDDIALGRLYLVGASYGAVTGTAVLAQERRIRAALLVVGGGNLPLLLKGREVRRHLPDCLVPLAARLLTFWIGPAEPLRHARHISSVPILMQNGSHDSVVIPESARALFAELREPKEIRWYPIDHPDREKRGGEVLNMLFDGLHWLRRQDASRAN